jgi:uncharacterized protein YwgA
MVIWWKGDVGMPDTNLRIDNRKDIVLLLLYAKGRSRQQNESISGRTRLMKLIYLFYQELAPKLSSFRSLPGGKQHHFLPYHFGPFSKDVFDDVQFLENAELIREESAGGLSMAESAEARLFYDDILLDSIESQEMTEDYYSVPVFTLTEKGLEFAEKLNELLQPREREAIDQFKAKYNGLPLSTLLRYVYKTYPGSAIKSQIA